MREELPGIAADPGHRVGAAEEAAHVSDRFLGRVEVYAQARPSYPAALRTWLASELASVASIVDIGAGTGLFTEMLLELGPQVIALEPNTEMRARLAERFADRGATGRLRVLDGTAEATGLPDRSVGLISAAQAAHWFSPVEARREFARILRPEGRVLLVWNDWRGSANPFNRDYSGIVERFLTPGNETVETRVPHQRIPELLPTAHACHTFANPVRLSRKRLHMLALSASYLPGPDSATAPALVQALDTIFDRHADGGEVTMDYRTVAYLGR